MLAIFLEFILLFYKTLFYLCIFIFMLVVAVGLMMLSVLVAMELVYKIGRRLGIIKDPTISLDSIKKVRRSGRVMFNNLQNTKEEKKSLAGHFTEDIWVDYQLLKSKQKK